MSRIPVPISVVDTAGNVLAGVSATVKNRASGSNVTLYNAETGGSTVGNPLTTDSQGRAFAYTDRQGLRIDYSSTLFTSYTEYREDAVPPQGIVSSLPGSPFDGQEIYFQSAGMATAGTVWHFRYRAGGGTYKWEYLGGPPLAVEGVGGRVDGTEESTTSTTITTLTTAGPAITAPLAGEFDCRLSVYGAQVGVNSSPVVFFWKTGDSTSTGWQNSDGNVYAAAVSGAGIITAQKRLTVASGDSIQVRYACSNATGGAKFRNRNLWVTPVRVG